MKKVLILIPLKKISVFVIAAMAVVAFSGLVFFASGSFSRSLQVSAIQKDEDYINLVKENERLKGVLESLTPEKDEVILEDEFRSKYMNVGEQYKPVLDYRVYSLKEVIQKGEKLNFDIVHSDPEYYRPVYDPGWKGCYYRSWIYIPYKVSEARHRLFTYYGGLSTIYDFEGSLGFEKSVAVDYHSNINFLVYKFAVRKVTMLDHQIVLTGEPSSTGVQVVAVKLSDVLPKGVDEKDLLFQLSTPGGYEIDYEYGAYAKSDYFKKLQGEEDKHALSVNDWDKAEEHLKEENRLLKRELSFYIPLEDRRISEKYCRTLPKENLTEVKDILKKGRKLSFDINYKNMSYGRPLYHPAWKRNYKKGWSFVPMKICQGLHKVFVIPGEVGARANLLGGLGFFESYRPIKNNEIGILVYEFSVDEVIMLDNQIVLKGRPERTGAQIITISRYNTGINKDLVIRVVTPDDYDFDFDILPHNEVSYLL